MEGNRNSIGGIANPFAQRSGLQIPTSAYCLSANEKRGTSGAAGAEKSKIKFELLTTIGQSIKLEYLESGVNIISVGELSTGIYHYVVKVDEVRKQSGKQVIVK